MPAAPTPSPTDPRLIAAVGVGGAAGATGRFLITTGLDPLIGVAAATMIINVLGSALLGVLLSVLAVAGPDTGGRRTVRLLAGTGLLGGFTTYSALSTGSAELLRTGPWSPAVAYGLGSVLLGVLAAAVGMALGSHLTRRREAAR